MWSIFSVQILKKLVFRPRKVCTVTTSNTLHWSKHPSWICAMDYIDTYLAECIVFSIGSTPATQTHTSTIYVLSMVKSKHAFTRTVVEDNSQRVNRPATYASNPGLALLTWTSFFFFCLFVIHIFQELRKSANSPPSGQQMSTWCDDQPAGHLLVRTEGSLLVAWTLTVGIYTTGL
jgi:hypothetical protein